MGEEGRTGSVLYEYATLLRKKLPLCGGCDHFHRETLPNRIEDNQQHRESRRKMLQSSLFFYQRGSWAKSSAGSRWVVELCIFSLYFTHMLMENETLSEQRGQKPHSLFRHLSTLQHERLRDTSMRTPRSPFHSPPLRIYPFLPTRVGFLSRMWASIGSGYCRTSHTIGSSHWTSDR